MGNIIIINVIQFIYTYTLHVFSVSASAGKLHRIQTVTTRLLAAAQLRHT